MGWRMNREAQSLRIGSCHAVMENELRKLFEQSDVIPLMVELDEGGKTFYQELHQHGIMIALRSERWWWYLESAEGHGVGGFATFGAELWDALRVYFLYHASEGASKK